MKSILIESGKVIEELGKKNDILDIKFEEIKLEHGSLIEKNMKQTIDNFTTIEEKHSELNNQCATFFTDTYPSKNQLIDDDMSKIKIDFKEIKDSVD